jgi:hypothetical protein
MEKEANQSHARDIEERIQNVREGITDADATGLIAGEQLITQAETMLPVAQRVALPSEDLHSALPQTHAAHATIDALDAELAAERPNAAAIQEHVGTLRGLPELRDRIITWYEDPRVQRFVSDLGQIGI